ncbi:MAG TPA: acyl-CoA synthetase [Bradyrhizobium sp.]|nr:acyl-CoA synthetase [Bradyrhizobium sp.]
MVVPKSVEPGGVQRQGVAAVVPETADAALLDQPLRCLADVEAIERIPLDQRLGIVDISHRIALGLAARDPDDTAIFYIPDGNVDSRAAEISFAALRRNLASTASFLRAGGIGRADVVAVLLPGVPAIYWSILGAMAAGIAFPLNWMLEPRHVLHLLKEAKAKAVIALGPTPGFRIWESLMTIAGDLAPGTAIWSVAGPEGEVLPDTDLEAHINGRSGEPVTLPTRTGDDIAVYMHSGGTTGLPKIVRMSHRNASYRHWASQLAYRAVVGEVAFHDSPMFHSGGLMGRCIPPLASGASFVIPSVMGARDKRFIANYWRFVEKYQVTRLSGVPTTLAVLTKSPPQGDDLSSLKPYFVTGSSAMPIPIRRRFEQISGVRVLNSYGMTENTASIAIDPRDGETKEGSSGIRLPYTQIRAMIDGPDRTARRCGPAEIGMLQIRGPGLTPGYVNPEHDRGARTGDGWLITGDLGRIDADGYVFVTGRAKDVIIRGGHNIDPALIEEPLLQSPDVLHAAAVGKPDAHAGELPVAFVQLVPGSQATPSDLIAYLAGRIAERAAIPKEILLVDKLPLTDVGKPDKAALRKQIAELTFRSVLSTAIGLSCEEGRLKVSVRQHPRQGTQVSIGLAPPPGADRGVLAATIDGVMGQYAFPYTIEWLEVGTA